MISYYSGKRPELISLIPGKYQRVLEVGCGAGGFRSNLDANCEYWGIEPSVASAKAERRLYRVLNGTYDQVETDLPDNYFDLVICNDVIEHMIDHDAFLRNIRRKMIGGGLIVGSLPNMRFIEVLRDLVIGGNWEYQGAGILDRTHLRFFTLKSVRNAFQRHGYISRIIRGVNAIQPTSLYHSLKIKVLSRILGEDIIFRQFGFQMENPLAATDSPKVRGKPRVSILIPTYNYARFISEALQSILSQDFTDFEVIISDDASSDDTEQVIKPYLERDDRIRYHRHAKNLGMVQNWNWCLEHAQGEYIKYLFADDMLTTGDALSKFVKMLEENPTAAMAISARYVVDENSDIQSVWDWIGREGVHRGRSIICRCVAGNANNLLGEPSATMFRKSDASRGFDLNYRQLVDLEMWLHLCENKSIVYTSEPLCAFRRHAEQQTEVNKRDTSTHDEPIRIRDTYSAIFRNDAANAIDKFRFMYAIFLASNPKHVGGIPNLQHQDWLKRERQKITGGWFFVCLLLYRGRRFYQNILHQFKKCGRLILSVLAMPREGPEKNL